MRSTILCLVLALCLSSMAPAWAQGTRDVSYDERAVPRVNTKVRFTTMIVLPETALPQFYDRIGEAYLGRLEAAARRNNGDLLVGLDGLHVIGVERDDGGRLVVEVESEPTVMGCPACGVVASRQTRAQTHHRARPTAVSRLNVGDTHPQ